MAGPAVGGPVRSPLAVFAASGCLGITLCLIASAIVLALIPVYLSTRSVTLQPSTLQSKLITMTTEVQSGTSGRRKRATGDLCDYAGGSFDDNGMESFRVVLRNKIKSKKVGGIIMNSVAVALASASKRKRSIISKRASCSTQYKTILVIKFYLIYETGCLYACQLNNGAAIQSELKAIDFTSVSLSNIGIYKGGVFYGYLPSMRFIGAILYISSIIPGTSGSDADGNPLTISPSSSSNSTTTTMTTTGPLMG